MSKTVLIFSAQEQLRSFQHRLYHYTRYTRQTHHPLVLEKKMLVTLNIKGNTANITLMQRSDHLGHNRIMHLSRKVQEFLFIIGCQLLNQRYIGCPQQSLYVCRIQITTLRQAINQATHLWHVNTIKLYVRAGGTGRIDHPRKSRTQCHLIREIDMAFLNKTPHFRTSGHDRRQNWEDWFFAFFHLLMKHLISIIQLHETRTTKDHHHQVYILKAILAIINSGR